MSVLIAKTAAAVEPPIDRNMPDLDPVFAAALIAVLNDLAAAGAPFKFNEGFPAPSRASNGCTGRAGPPRCRTGDVGR